MKSIKNALIQRLRGRVPAKRLRYLWRNRPRDAALPWAASLLPYFFEHRRDAANMHAFHGWLPVYQERSIGLPLLCSVDPAKQRKVGVFLHAFYPQMVPLALGYLKSIPAPADLCVSTDTQEKADQIAKILLPWNRGKVIIRVTPNRGRDIAPFLVGFKDLIPAYDYVLKIHTKKSPHEVELRDWAQFLYRNLVGSPTLVSHMLHCFEAIPSIGMLAPQHIEFLRPWINWGSNYEEWRWLAFSMRLPLLESFHMPLPCDFPSGSMFWARPQALQPLLDAGLDYGHFPEETGQADGTLAHAIERMFFYSCEKSGLSWFKTADPNQYAAQWSILRPRSDDELKAMVLAWTKTLYLYRASRDDLREHSVGAANDERRE